MAINILHSLPVASGRAPCTAPIRASNSSSYNSGLKWLLSFPEKATHNWIGLNANSTYMTEIPWHTRKQKPETHFVCSAITWASVTHVAVARARVSTNLTAARVSTTTTTTIHEASRSQREHLSSMGAMSNKHTHDPEHTELTNGLLTTLVAIEFN